MATFLRQLNNYGFRKSAKDSSKLEFENEFFRRSEPQNYHKIKNRRKRSRTSELPITNEASTALLSLAALPWKQPNVSSREKKELPCSSSSSLSLDGQRVAVSGVSEKSLPKSGAIKKTRKTGNNTLRGEKQGDPCKVETKNFEEPNGKRRNITGALLQHDVQNLMEYPMITNADDTTRLY